MGFNRIFIILIIRIIFIAASAFLLAYTAINMHSWVLSTLVSSAIFLQCTILYHSVCEHWNNIDKLFESIENDDFSFIMKGRYKDKYYEKILTRMNNLTEKLKLLRIENQHHAQYLNAIVEHINIGVIVFDEHGTFNILNRHAKKLLGIGNIKLFSMLESLMPEFYNSVMNLQSGKKIVVKMPYEGEIIPLSLMLSEYCFLGKKVRLLTFQNIKSELEEKELESWQNLIRVLSHEIMNSVGPITSSIDTLTELIQDNRNSGESTINVELSSDIEKGITIIKERSIGIRDFVHRFRSISVLPKLNCSQISINSMFEHVTALFNETLNKEGIHFKAEVFPADLAIIADKALIEQVVINLVKNAIEALTDKQYKKIELKAFKNFEEKVIVEVIDNGRGIDNNIIDKIFIPFFTTKEKGSGIGLNLSQQIMRLHKGRISINSKINEEKTIFTLIF